MEFDRYLEIRKAIMKKQVDKFNDFSKQELIHVCTKLFESEQRLKHLLNEAWIPIHDNGDDFMKEYKCEWVESK